MQVSIGRFYSAASAATSVPAKLDIPLLVESGGFIQAASGFGKTTLLAKAIEATHPHIQQIIIDPEGDFSPLRANHDFVIAAANNGDALAHPRTAALLATRLLETRASAILDIYDLKPRERHEFVREFINSMMNAPKNLWHPVLVFIDEAHLFCPEKGFGESVATEAVIDLAGRGRKRGFRLVAATQRIAKFSKSAAMELHTKFIGYAGIDDVKRAAFELGMEPRYAVMELRKLKPGEFYAYGRALEVIDPILFRSDLPKTQLSRAGKRKLIAPPKPTDKIRALLPQLADIPKEVEQKAKTEAELRKDLADARSRIQKLEAEQRTAFLRTPEKAAPAKKPNYKEAHRLAKKYRDEMGILLRTLGGELRRDVEKLAHEWEKKLFHQVNHDGENFLEKIKAKIEEDPIVISGPKPEPIKIVVPHEAEYRGKTVTIDDAKRGAAALTGPEKKILDAIAWMAAATGKDTVSQTAAAFLAGYTPGSSSFRNPRSSLAAQGLIEYVDSDLRLTLIGSMAAYQPIAKPTAEEIQNRVLGLLDGPQTKLLKLLLDVYPNGYTQELHAESAGYTPGSSSYRNPRSKLSALELLRYEGDMVYAQKWLFLE